MTRCQWVKDCGYWAGEQCGEEYSLTEPGLEPTKYCNECAHVVVAELESEEPMTDEITEIIESNERMREALKECYDWFRNEGSDAVYGFFRGGDPRNFSPDPDCSTEDEQAAWEADCKAWNEAEKQGASMKPLPGCCTFSKDMILTRSGYGLGVNACENEEADRMTELCLGALGGKP